MHTIHFDELLGSILSYMTTIISFIVVHIVQDLTGILQFLTILFGCGIAFFRFMHDYDKWKERKKNKKNING